MPYANPAEQKAFQGAYYLKNRLLYRDRQRVWQATYNAFVRAYKEKHPCTDCGESDPIVLDFDHRPDEEKLFNIGDARNYKLSRIAVEIEKCDVRCANYHRRETARRRGEL